MKKLFRKDFFRQKFFFSLFENSNFQAKQLIYICLCLWENPRNRVSNLVGPVSQSYPVSQPWVRDCFVWMSLNLFSVSPDSISVSFFLFLGSRLLCLRLLCVNESQSFALPPDKEKHHLGDLTISPFQHHCSALMLRHTIYAWNSAIWACKDILFLKENHQPSTKILALILTFDVITFWSVTVGDDDCSCSWSELQWWCWWQWWRCINDENGDYGDNASSWQCIMMTML